MYRQVNGYNGSEPAIQYHQLEVVKSLSRLLTQELDLLANMPAFVEKSVKNGTPICFFTELQRFECRLIRSALIRSMGNQTKAAKLLNLKPSTLNSKIKHSNIDLLGFKSAA